MSTVFIPNTDGPFKVFQPPQPGMVYTMGVDASTGLAQDNSVVQVLTNAMPFQQVAVFAARWPVNKVTEMVDRIGRWYHDALAVCEVNFPGNSIQDALLQYYCYPRNYQPEQHLHEDPDTSPKFGFRTTETTKWMLIHQMQMAMSAGELQIHDPDTISEMQNFVYQDSSRKASAAQGFQDDRVMALLLALHGAKLYPITSPVRMPMAPTAWIKSRDPDTRKDWRQFQQMLADRMNNKIEEDAIL